MRWHRAGEAGHHKSTPTPLPAAASGAAAANGAAGPGAGGGPGFIGRTTEQQLFVELLDAAAAGQSAFVHLTGTARSGRRALLEQFSALAAAHPGARCSPVVDFEQDAGLELDQVLERLAGGLEPERERLKGFFEATGRLRSREAGLPTRTAQAVAVVRAGSSAVSQLAGVLPVKAVNAAIQSPLGDVLTEHAESRRTLSAVSDEFVRGLLELARDSGPLLLLFSDVDFAASSAKLLWLRRSLFPRIARARVVVAVSTDPHFDLEDVRALFARTERMALDRFTKAEAEEFLERHVDLDAGSPLGRAVLEDSDRFPERLAGYAQYFREHPDARSGERLPTEARDLTAGGLVSGLLSRIPDPFLRDVVLYAAPLRWFNAELLRGIQEVCGLEQPGEGRGAPGLLDLGMRPSWVSNVGGGWGIDVEARRRAIVDEFRRLHPSLYRRVHLHAALYHLARLRELEGAQASDQAGPVGAEDESLAFGYRPLTHPSDRYRWGEYLASLGEWLYHVVALSPRRGFARLADHVGEALAWGYPAAAVTLLDIGVELNLPGSETLARQRLLEVARALHGDRHAETLQLLGEFAAGGSASAIADAAARFLVGTRLVLLGRAPLTVYENFERAEKLLAAADPGVQASSLRCLNLTRLATEKVRRDQGGEGALVLLSQAAELARDLDPRMQAEIERVRGLILGGVRRLPEALAACDLALELLGGVGAAAEAALVLCLRADLHLEAGSRAPARRDLLSARSIYRQLVDPVAEAQVLLGLLDIALREGDDSAAAEQEAAIALLRPDDFLVRNQTGNLYYQAGRHEQAVDRYTSALALASEAALFANRGRARLKWADQLAGDSSGASGQPAAGTDREAAVDDLRRLAREDLAAAFQADPDDLDTGIELAELERRLGAGSAAAGTAELVARRAVEFAQGLPALISAAPGDPPADSSDRTSVARRLRELLVRSLTLLEPGPAAEILEAWAAHLPDDEELELVRAIIEDELSAGDRDGLLRAIAAAERAAVAADPPRGRALVELAALHARARHWDQAKAAAESAVQDERVRVQAEYMLDRLDQMHRREDEFGGEPETLVEALVVDIAEDLRPGFDPNSPVGSDFFDWMLDRFRRARAERVGLPAPGLWVGVRKDLPPGTLQVVVDNRVRARLTVGGDLLAGASPEECSRRAGVDGKPGTRPWDGGPATWLGAGTAEPLTGAGIPCWDVRGLVLAALDQALEDATRFVSAEEAANLSGESWAELPPSEFLARAEIVRRLLAKRVPPRELAAVLHAYREADAPGAEEVLADAVRRLAVPRAAPADLAAAFAQTVLRRPEASAAVGGRSAVAVRIRVAAGGQLEEVAGVGRRVIGELCGVLHLPVPELRVEVDPALAVGMLTVRVGEVTRLVASEAGELDWWRRHPAAGPGGRTRLAAGGLAATVGRALEAVLWDDPALLLPEVDAAREALEPMLGSLPSKRLAGALLEVLARRVPLGPQPKLKRACEHVLDRSNSGRLRLPGALTFVSAPRRPIPDNLPFGIRDTLAVRETGRLRQFAVRVQLHHDEESDLRVSLTSPSGRTVVLHDAGDDLGALRTGVDEERLPALAPLLNEEAAGNWTLHVQDVSSSDAGLLEEWAIELTTVSSHPGQAEPSANAEIVLTYAERDALARCASLERDLRSRRIEAQCGAGLWSALEEGVLGGRLQQERVRLGTHLARELGLRFGHSIHFTPALDLPDHGFRILVNGLARATGDLPPGRYGQADSPLRRSDADVWVGPLTAMIHRRLPEDVPGGFDAPDRLMRHVRACVREAAAEFADADWAGAFLDRLAHTYHHTVPAVRAAAGDDLLAALLRELVTQGIAVADPRLLELVRELVSSPELAGECLALAAAPPGHLGRTAGAMAEWLREGLDEGDPDPGLPLLELGPVMEAAVRLAVGSSSGRVPVYALPEAGDVLRRLEEARAALGAVEFAVVTAAALRRHVHRLIAAQFPTARVMAREQLDVAIPRELVELAATPAATPPESG